MPAKRQLKLHTETWSYARPFRITGHCYTEQNIVVVELVEDGYIGRGEAWFIRYNDETLESVCQQIESVAEEVEQGISREALQSLLPSGGARNAIDCALWDLEAKQTGQSIWQLLGIQPRPITTALTIGIEETPEQMAMYAQSAAAYNTLKIKLDSDRPVERIEAIRAARPDAQLVIDANQAWTIEQLKEVAPPLAKLGVDMIEQPLRRGADADLAGYQSPVILSADESCLDCSELDAVADYYQMINIKLDKTGGLTEALRLVKAVQAKGLELMIGNMGGTSLCIAPALVVAQFCRVVDLDGPLLLKHDRLHSLDYRGGDILLPSPSLWG